MTEPSKILPSSHSIFSSVSDNETTVAQRWLLVCLFFQLIIWTLLPTLLIHGAYVDVLENWEWGRHFQWGYDKDPVVAAWLTYWVLHWTKGAMWTTYLIGQISVTTAVIVMWQLAKRILPPLHALISVSLLITIFFYNIGATELNDDVIQIGLWALTILFFYNAIKEQKNYQWLLVGLTAGLASMDKYFTLMLLLSMFTFLLINQQARTSFKKLGLYLGLLVFFIIVIPNFIWLITHAFVAINYAFDSASFTQSAFTNGLAHFINPLVFIISMLAVVLLLFPILLGSFGNKEKINFYINGFDQQFLLSMFLGPFIYVLLFLLLTGAKFRFVWATPLFNLVGIILIVQLKPALTPKKLRNYFIIVTVFVIVWMLAFLGNITVSPFFRHDLKHRFELYPGKEMALALTQSWHNRYHRPLLYVAGDRELVVYISYYSPDHPQGYFDWNPASSQWIDENDLKNQGGIFVWNNGNNDTVTLDPGIRARFLNVTQPNIFNFNLAFSHWFTHWVTLKEPDPLKLGIAFLPPSNHL